jgi:hypothetical protein
LEEFPVELRYFAAFVEITMLARKFSRANAEKQGVADLVVVKVPETWIYRVRQS